MEPPPPSLFVFAHHDDELFIAATMRRLALTGGQVLAAWLTRGGLHGNRREAESRRATELLNVKPENLYFFGLPDGRALDYLDDIVNRLAALLKKRRPGSVFVPAFEGGHPDHDCVQLAAAAAVRDFQPQGGKPELYEFPMYHRRRGRPLAVGEFLPGGGPTLYTPLKLGDRLLKRKLAGIYSSQRLITWPLLALKGGPMMLHLRGEPYRPVPPDRDYTRPPHPGRLAYEFYTRIRFKDFAEKARRLVSSFQFPVDNKTGF